MATEYNSANKKLHDMHTDAWVQYWCLTNKLALCWQLHDLNEYKSFTPLYM